MNERPTPETDAVAEAVGMGHFMVDSDFARKLERERDKSREDATNYYAKIGELEHELNNMQDQRDLAMKVTARLERERDEAREVLDRASLYISNHTGSCPYDLFDIEPHDSPCSEVCGKYTNDMHLCWKKHFANKEGAK